MCANSSTHASTTPYLLDVQSDLLDVLDSRVVVPLRSIKHFPEVKLSTRLTPLLTIFGEEFFLETPKMAAVPKRVLKSPLISVADN